MKIEAFDPGPIARNALNRWRRNCKRKLSRKFRGYLRRLDARADRKSEYAWHEKAAKNCCCLWPHPCPCEGVLTCGFCDELGYDDDHYYDEEDDL